MSDFYTRAVATVLNIPESSVTTEKRNEAKHICFGIMYGSSRFARDFDMTKLLRPETEQSPLTDDEVFEEVCKMLRLAWGL